MGTKSRIIVHCRDQRWRRTRYGFDGQITFTGRMLHQNYNSQEAADELVMLGDIESFEKTIAESKFYHRDHGRSLLIPNAETLEAAWGNDPDPADFTYAWMDGCWHVADLQKQEQLTRLDDPFISRVYQAERGED